MHIARLNSTLGLDTRSLHWAYAHTQVPCTAGFRMVAVEGRVIARSVYMVSNLRGSTPQWCCWPTPPEARLVGVSKAEA